MISFDTLLAVTSGGLVLGAIYALMAAGLAAVWTTLGIFNFAHGAFIALGAYIGWQIADAQGAGLGLALGVAGAVVTMFFAGILFHLVLVRPFERRPDIVTASVITTLAASHGSPARSMPHCLSGWSSPIPTISSGFIGRLPCCS